MVAERNQTGVTNAPILSDIDPRLRFSDAEMVTEKNEAGVKGIPTNESKTTAGDGADPASSKTFHSLSLVMAENINDVNKFGILPWDKTIADGGRYGERCVVLDRDGNAKQLKINGNARVDPSLAGNTEWEEIGHGGNSLNFNNNSILGLGKAGDVTTYTDIKAIPLVTADNQFYNGMQIQLLPTDISEEILTPRNHTNMQAVVNGCNGTMSSELSVNTSQGANFNVRLNFTSSDSGVKSYISLADLTTPRTYVEKTDLTVGDFLSRINVSDLEFKAHWKMFGLNSYQGIINEDGFDDYNQDLFTNRTLTSSYSLNGNLSVISYSNNFDDTEKREQCLTDHDHIGRRTRLARVNKAIVIVLEYWSPADNAWIEESSGVVLSDNVVKWSLADFTDGKYTVLSLFQITNGVALARSAASLGSDPESDDGTLYTKIFNEDYLYQAFLTETQADGLYRKLLDKIQANDIASGVIDHTHIDGYLFLPGDSESPGNGLTMKESGNFIVSQTIRNDTNFAVPIIITTQCRPIHKAPLPDSVANVEVWIAIDGHILDHEGLVYTGSNGTYGSFLVLRPGEDANIQLYGKDADFDTYSASYRSQIDLTIKD